MLLNKKQKDEFVKKVEPLIKYINDNFHPHVTLVINHGNVELVEGIFNFITYEYIKDKGVLKEKEDAPRKKV